MVQPTVNQIIEQIYPSHWTLQHALSISLSLSLSLIPKTTQIDDLHSNIAFVSNMKDVQAVCQYSESNLLTIQRTVKFWRDLQVVENIMIVFREQLNNFFTGRIEIP